MPDALVAILKRWMVRLDHTPPPEKITHLHTREGCRPAPPWLTREPDRAPDPSWLFPGSRRVGPWTGGRAEDRALARLRRLGERAGVRGLTFASLRHTYATHLEYFGCSDGIIQRILRHTNTKTQHKYRHAEAANLRQSVASIRFDADPAKVEPIADPAAALAEALARIAAEAGADPGPLAEVAAFALAVARRIEAARKDGEL
jgi:integrase